MSAIIPLRMRDVRDVPTNPPKRAVASRVVDCGDDDTFSAESRKGIDNRHCRGVDSPQSPSRRAVSASGCHSRIAIIFVQVARVLSIARASFALGPAAQAQSRSPRGCRQYDAPHTDECLPPEQRVGASLTIAEALREARSWQIVASRWRSARESRCPRTWSEALARLTLPCALPLRVFCLGAHGDMPCSVRRRRRGLSRRGARVSRETRRPRPSTGQHGSPERGYRHPHRSPR